jgi:hypothetical protein
MDSELEADILRDLTEADDLTGFEHDIDPPYGKCGFIHRDGGRAYKLRNNDSWWGISARIKKWNPESKFSVWQYMWKMRKDPRNQGKRFWPGTVIYLPPVITVDGWRTPKCL